MENTKKKEGEKDNSRRKDNHERVGKKLVKWERVRKT